MKKILAAAAMVFCLSFCLSGCTKSDPFVGRISDLIDGLYAGESPTLSVTVAVGKREDPYLADGTPAETVPLFTVCIEPKVGFSEGEEFAVSTVIRNESYSAKASYSAHRRCFVADLTAADVTDPKLTITVYRNG